MEKSIGQISGEVLLALDKYYTSLFHTSIVVFVMAVVIAVSRPQETLIILVMGGCVGYEALTLSIAVYRTCVLRQFHSKLNFMSLSGASRNYQKVSGWLPNPVTTDEAVAAAVVECKRANLVSDCSSDQVERRADLIRLATSASRMIDYGTYGSVVLEATAGGFLGAALLMRDANLYVFVAMFALGGGLVFQLAYVRAEQLLGKYEQIRSTSSYAV